jgi:hypothetical protein
MWFPFRRRLKTSVETAQLANRLLIELETIAAEHHERDAREGIVLLADELMKRLELFTPEHRERAAALVIASLCTVCAARRSAAKMRRRAKRAASASATAPGALPLEAPMRSRKW